MKWWEERRRRGRPPLNEPRQNITLRLAPITLAQLADLATRTGSPRARLIERAVAELYMEMTP